MICYAILIYFPLLQLTFEDVQSAFLKYGVEVQAWEDVPFGVQQLAYERRAEAVPDRELCSP